MRTNSNFTWILLLVVIIIDIYVFQAVKVVCQHSGPRLKLTIYIIYWLVSAIAVTCIILLPYLHSEQHTKILRAYIFPLLLGFFLSKVLAATFVLIDDVRRGIMWLVGKLFSNPSVEISQVSDGITRSAFLSWVGIAVGTTLFGSLLYGMRNKYRYQVQRIKLSFNNLPPAFKGLRIIQISDIHSGSFDHKKSVEHGVDMILKEKADLILFTGDLVNDRASEMTNYMDVFNRLHAPMGVYSTLGNHDYGDYVNWPSAGEKHTNLERLKQIHGELGWKLLMNEHVIFERDGQQIALLGIENWGAKGHFPKYGKMQEAYPGTENIPFKILMSHDPSHWDAEVKPSYPDIDLTLSGHTHGMQFGVELPGIKWSPVQYMYQEWAGLYKDGKQKLYVNRGFGFLGYPGRVGILPEITVIELA